MKKTIHAIINDRGFRVSVAPGSTLLSLLRGNTGHHGVKEGCGEGECGACTVLLGRMQGDTLVYSAVAACLTPAVEAHGSHVVTIEGLNLNNRLNALQHVFVEEGATQCGFCTPGFILSLTGYLLSAAAVTGEGAIRAMDGNICRCTGHIAIHRAARKVADWFSTGAHDSKDRIPLLIARSVIPDYFSEIATWLGAIPPLAKTLRSAAVVAGGTDLYVQRREELAESDISLLMHKPEFSQISCSPEGTIIIGAAVTVSKLMEHTGVGKAVPGIDKAMELISSTIIRNRATIGGNIVNASPIGDLSVIFLALGAQLNLVQGGKHRTVPLAGFFTGYKQTVLKKGELIESISFKALEKGERFSFEKVSQRRHLDIASVNCAVRLRIDAGVVVEAALSAGGVAPYPLLLKKTSAALAEGRREELLSVLEGEIAPISDIRGSAEYKKSLLKRLISVQVEEVLAG